MAGPRTPETACSAACARGSGSSVWVLAGVFWLASDGPGSADLVPRQATFALKSPAGAARDFRDIRPSPFSRVGGCQPGPALTAQEVAPRGLNLPSPRPTRPVPPARVP